MLTVPGRTFPITDHVVEDALEATGWAVRGKPLLRGDAAEAELAGAGEGYSESTRSSLLRLPPDGVCPAGLIAALLSHLDASRPKGHAVLLFLPGVAEIRTLARELALAPAASRWLLLPLHAELPAAEQKRVFAPPPPGVRKVVLATNVAETSLTVADVAIVLDSGRVKLAGYDAAGEYSSLTEGWVPLSRLASPRRWEPARTFSDPSRRCCSRRASSGAAARAGRGRASTGRSTRARSARGWRSTPLPRCSARPSPAWSSRSSRSASARPAPSSRARCSRRAPTPWRSHAARSVSPARSTRRTPSPRSEPTLRACRSTCASERWCCTVRSSAASIQCSPSPRRSRRAGRPS